MPNGSGLIMLIFDGLINWNKKRKTFLYYYYFITVVYIFKFNCQRRGLDTKFGFT